MHDDLASFGTGGGERLESTDVALALRTLRAVLARVGIDFEPQFRDYDSFRSYWMRSGASGSWQARRDLLAPCSTRSTPGWWPPRSGPWPPRWRTRSPRTR